MFFFHKETPTNVKTIINSKVSVHINLLSMSVVNDLQGWSKTSFLHKFKWQTPIAMYGKFYIT